MDDIFNLFAKSNNFKIIKNLGEGSFGVVKEIFINDKIYAAKLIKKEKNEYEDESKLILEFRGLGIIKVNKIYTLEIGKKENEKEKEIYYLIVMEKATLKNLSKFIYKMHNSNILKLIYKNPFDLIGENLLRFFTKQLIKGFELLNRSNYTHFDIKPGNILIFMNMIIKITDFGLLRNPKKIINEKNEFHVPGGTRGYMTPEYYSQNGYIKYEDAVKQDYFALGSTLFCLKFGEDMLEYSKYLNYISISDIIIDLLQKAMDKIKSQKLCEKELIEFLCSLIQYKPEDRPDLEIMYRNKWLNKNSEEIKAIAENFEYDEEKLLLELDKSDFILNKRNEINKSREKENQNENENQNQNQNNMVKYNKFKFKL